MNDCIEFYKLRDLRTTEYITGAEIATRPVYVAIDQQAAGTPAGQFALLTLANQLVRVHREIAFDIPNPDIPVAVRTPFPGAALGETLLNTTRTIDPCGDFNLAGRPSGLVTSIGLGAEVGTGFDWYLGADRAIAKLSRVATGFSTKPSTLVGAGLASCLGAAAVLRSHIGRETAPRILSAWNYAEGDQAASGPDILEALDVGRVLMAGAGAVGASLLYWLYAFGITGEWTIVDGDVVELHNTNRGLVFTPAQAGWPSMGPGKAAQKAELLSSLVPNSRFFNSWYDQCASIKNEKFDVILGLANDRDVRHFLASRNATVTLHATTGSNWLSQLHRHIHGKDDCIWCRAGEAQTPMLGCSTGDIERPDGTSSDAALPFLSAASGLMLATSLQRLQRGELATDTRNDWRWDFDSTFRMVSSGFRRCRADCVRIHRPSIRRRINAGGRWLSLDDGSERT